MTPLLPLLLQQVSEPVGPGGWSVRNYMGLLCQVVVFVLLVAFIFWLADLGERDEEKTEAEPKPAAEDNAGADAPKSAS